MDTSAVIATALAAVAALLSAVSALASWRSTKAVQDEVRLERAVKSHELARSFEQDYAAQYGTVWSVLGPWPDPIEIDEDLRRVVHDLLQTVVSIYIAGETSLIGDDQANSLYAVYFDWLSTAKAKNVWRSVFAIQVETWPSGFVEFVESQIRARELREQVKRQDPSSSG